MCVPSHTRWWRRCSIETLVLDGVSPAPQEKYGIRQWICLRCVAYTIMLRLSTRAEWWLLSEDSQTWLQSPCPSVTGLTEDPGPPLTTPPPPQMRRVRQTCWTIHQWWIWWVSPPVCLGHSSSIPSMARVISHESLLRVLQGPTCRTLHARRGN